MSLNKKPKKLSHVLIVEDEPDIRAITQLSLERLAKLRCSQCDDGSSAVDTASKVSPDLIILDTIMPQMDGPETIKALHSNPLTQTIPVIFLTAWADPELLAQHRSYGAIGMIQKPFSPTRLPQQIQQLWEEHCA